MNTSKRRDDPAGELLVLTSVIEPFSAGREFHQPKGSRKGVRKRVTYKS